MEELPTEINIITLNCWGLKYLSKLRSERLAEIGLRIATAEPTPHIVGLQECWTQEDYERIRRETRFVLPYGKFYHSGVFGGGLAILSKWPLEESTMFKYPLNGRPQAFYRGDWFVGKGVAHARIRYGAARHQVLEVFNTHTHAPYEEEPTDSYLCHRTAQAWEMTKLLRGAAERGHLVVGLGDFNMLPLSLAHRLITSHAPVRDAWRVLHPDSSLGAAADKAEQLRRRPIPTADFNVQENGVTSDSVYNTWRWTPEQRRRLARGEPCDVPRDAIDRRGKRLDYIFVGTGDAHTGAGASGWVVKSAKVGMIERHPTLHCSLSDHFSVEATLVAHKLSDPGSSEDALTNGAYLQSPTSSEPRSSNQYDAQLRASLTNETPLSRSAYDEILTMITAYRRRELSQRRWRAGHFFASIFVFITCLIGVWFVPKNFVSFILLLLSGLSLVAGVIDGLIALIFFKTELRALKEFEWEIRNAKEMASGGPVTQQGSDKW